MPICNPKNLLFVCLFKYRKTAKPIGRKFCAGLHIVCAFSSQWMIKLCSTRAGHIPPFSSRFVNSQFQLLKNKNFSQPLILKVKTERQFHQRHFSFFLNYCQLMISIILTTLTENFQQPLTALAFNGTITTKLMAFTARSVKGL